MGSGSGRTLSAASATVVQDVPAGTCGPDGVPSKPSKTNAKYVQDLESRVHKLEEIARTQAEQLHNMEQALRSVQKDTRRTVSVLQYNILASYLGKNTQPWFLYGAEVEPEDRQRIMERFLERDETGTPKHSWPSYVEGILTPTETQQVELFDKFFRWEERKVRLVQQILNLDADVISLVELDQYDHFAECLNHEWDSAFHKRPRTASLDGCGVFWRRSKFELLQSQAIDFVDGSDDKGREKRDRSCLMTLLRWRACGTNLVVVSTHLAKDPENRAQTAIRVRQVTQLMEYLTEFTNLHQAADAPVILLGDLNARHFGEIRGIARTVWQIKGSPIHMFLWSATDVPTGPTSITKARQVRIDVVQFLSSQLEVLDIIPVPMLRFGEVIPNAEHPSDHLPVCVRFKLKESYRKHKECARAWLECVAGKEKLHPLTEPELRIAFQFFDRDCSGQIHRYDLEEACLEMQCNFQVDVQQLLLDCFPDQQISYSNFIRAYEARLNHERIRCIGDLESAFQFFAEGTGRLSKARLEAAFREITPISFTDEEVKEMICRLEVKGEQESVDLRRFCEVVCSATFPHRDRRKFTKGPHQGPRSVTKEIGKRLDRLHERLAQQAVDAEAKAKPEACYIREPRIVAS